MKRTGEHTFTIYSRETAANCQNALEFNRILESQKSDQKIASLREQLGVRELPSQPPTKTGSPVVLQGQGNDVLVLGKPKTALTSPQYNVIQALLEAGAAGLNKDNLIEKSGHSDARGILKRLAASDAEWGRVIIMPGKPGGKYRVRTNPH